jgi:cell division protein FtsN
MEETPSWKGHSFTLLVFTGIVVLCSIFFVLGMLVGRSQGQRIAEAALGDDAHKNKQAQPLPDTTGLSYVEQATAAKPDDSFLAPPTTAEPTDEKPSSAAPPPPPPESEPIVSKSSPDRPYVQIIATKSELEADKVLKKVQSKGFKAKIVPLVKPGEKEAMNRVWVGPYESATDATMAIQQLDAAGFHGAYIPK